MNDNTYRVRVAKDLADLIPTFMKNRKKEIHSLRAALASADFEQLRQLGHRMKGVGVSYGFEQISVFGKDVENGARNNDGAAVQAAIEQYDEYLSRVEVAYD